MSETKSTQLSEKYMRTELMNFIIKSIPRCEECNNNVLESMKREELEKYMSLMDMIRKGGIRFPYFANVEGFYFKFDDNNEQYGSETDYVVVLTDRKDELYCSSC